MVLTGQQRNDLIQAFLVGTQTMGAPEAKVQLLIELIIDDPSPGKIDKLMEWLDAVQKTTERSLASLDREVASQREQLELSLGRLKDVKAALNGAEK